MECITCSFKPK